jgi:threonine synthase
MGEVRALKCRECGIEYEPQFKYICEECFGPLDVQYNFPSNINREVFSSRNEKSYWRYFEMLPVAKSRSTCKRNGRIKKSIYKK